MLQSFLPFILCVVFHMLICVSYLNVSDKFDSECNQIYFYDKFQHLKCARIMLLIATDDIDIPDHMCHRIFIDSLYNML